MSNGRIVKYTIISSDDHLDVTRTVNVMLAEGWEVFGGIAVSTSRPKDWGNKVIVIYAQTMVKRD